MVSPTELQNGTNIYFKVGTGTVFEGEVLGEEQLIEEFPANSFEEPATLVRVYVDQETNPEDEDLPDHIAPEQYQNQSTQFDRDAYKMTTNTPEYIVREEDIVEVLS